MILKCPNKFYLKPQVLDLTPVLGILSLASVRTGFTLNIISNFTAIFVPSQ